MGSSMMGSSLTILRSRYNPLQQTAHGMGRFDHPSPTAPPPVNKGHVAPSRENPRVEGMTSASSYREEKEKFYQGHSGGSSLEIVLITAVPPVAVLFTQCIGLCLLGRSPSGLSASILSVLCITLPTYASFVSSSSVSYILAFQLAVSAACIIAKGARPFPAALQDMSEALNRPHKPFLASYRGMMMLATCIAILAVDFQNFPRRLAKTETYGVSLMDAGVGSVLLSQAIVSPLARRPATAAAKRGLSALTSSLPLILIGSVRLFGVKAADYHEHKSEYGVHWNFFFTLAAVTTLGNMLPLTGWRAAACAFLLTACYEIALNATPLSAWMLDSPRTGFLSANREGIMGCIGYSAVFYGGVALGGVLASTKPRTGPQWIRVAFGLASAGACMWACAWGMETALGLRVSRRLVNASYVVWTLAYNTTALSLFLLLEIALHFAKGSMASSVLAWRAADKGRHCEILCDAINRNQLFIFLVSNLSTGLVNMTLPTLYATNTQADTTMVAYCLFVSTVAIALERAQMTLKFW